MDEGLPTSRRPDATKTIGKLGASTPLVAKAAPKPAASLVALLGVGKKAGVKGGGASSQRTAPKAMMNKPWSLVVKDPLAASAAAAAAIEGNPEPRSATTVGPTLGEAAEAAKKGKEAVSGRLGALLSNDSNRIDRMWSQNENRSNSTDTKLSNTAAAIGAMGGHGLFGGTNQPTQQALLKMHPASWAPFPVPKKDIEDDTTAASPQRPVDRAPKRPARKQRDNNETQTGNSFNAQVAFAIWRYQQSGRDREKRERDQLNWRSKRRSPRPQEEVPPLPPPPFTPPPVVGKSVDSNDLSWPPRWDYDWDYQPTSAAPLPACQVHPGLARMYARQNQISGLPTDPRPRIR